MSELSPQLHDEQLQAAAPEQSELSKRAGSLANSAVGLLARMLDQKDSRVKVSKGIGSDLELGMPQDTWITVAKPKTSQLNGEQCRINIREARMIRRSDGSTGYDRVTVEVHGTKADGQTGNLFAAGDGYVLHIGTNSETGYPELTSGLHTFEGGGASMPMAPDDRQTMTGMAEAITLTQAANEAVPAYVPLTDNFSATTYHLGK